MTLNRPEIAALALLLSGHLIVLGRCWMPGLQPKVWQIRHPQRQTPELLMEVISVDKGGKSSSSPGNSSLASSKKRDWDHYSIHEGDPHFLFSEEYYKHRNTIDTETIVEVMIPIVAPVIAFFTYDAVSSSFNEVLDIIASNNWRPVDGGAFQAKIITPTINGIVLPAIAVLFATLVSTTIRTLRDRQIDIRSCINTEAGELRAFEYLISAYPIGSELQARCRQYLVQYTSRIIAESQPLPPAALLGEDLPSTERGMDSELNGVLSALANTRDLPNLIHDQSFQSVTRLRVTRQNRLTALQSTYPPLHYFILAVLAVGEMMGFLIESDQELLVFLNAVQLKILWSMLVSTFVACFGVCYDLLNPFSGCYQVRGAVDQLHTIRLGLKAQTQMSLLDLRSKPNDRGGPTEEAGALTASAVDERYGTKINRKNTLPALSVDD